MKRLAIIASFFGAISFIFLGYWRGQNGLWHLLALDWAFAVLFLYVAVERLQKPWGE